MSLESALDEERREVMALLEGRPSAPRAGSRDPQDTLRAASPAGAAQSPVRSMLDIRGDPPAARNASIAGPSTGARSQTSAPFSSSSVRSMLDTSSPPPTPGTAPLPSQRQSQAGSKLNPEEAYQFEMLPSIESHAMPKRVSQGGKRQEQQPKKKSALASVFGSSKNNTSDNDYLRARHNSTSGTLGSRRAMSPSSRLGGNARSMSPAQSKLNTNSFNLMPDPGKYVTDSGKVIDMSSAYRRLSDAALLRSGGNLADLPNKKGSAEKGESLAPDGSARLEKDYFADDDDEEALESDEERGSSEDEAWPSEKRRRGRGRTRRKTEEKADSDSPMPGGENGREPRSLLAAAEDERKSLSSNYRYRSLLEPEVTVTTPDGEKMTAKRAGIHPNTNFDMGDASGRSTPVDSDTEADMSDIRRAQRMALNVSPVHSTPESHRCVRQILRGEYDKLQKEAEMGLRRQRMYLVATDLSDEAAYALEWTIGTVLRDGDTLLAVYAVDEELGTGSEGVGVGIGEGAAMMSDTAKVVQTLSNEQKESTKTLNIGSSPLSNVDNAANGESPTLPDFESMDKAERERWHAAQEVGDRCVKLLRKTRLQVRVVVEVFHCKSPKHMITEVVRLPPAHLLSSPVVLD